MPVIFFKDHSIKIELMAAEINKRVGGTAARIVSMMSYNEGVLVAYEEAPIREEVVLALTEHADREGTFKDFLGGGHLYKVNGRLARLCFLR